jgi:hypothetical protein
MRSETSEPQKYIGDAARSVENSRGTGKIRVSFDESHRPYDLVQIPRPAGR